MRNKMMDIDFDGWILLDDAGKDYVLKLEAELLETLTKLDDYLEGVGKIKRHSRIHDMIQEAIRKAKEN